MSENSQEIPEKFSGIYYVEDLYPKSEGFSWRKIPAPLFNLPELIKAKSNDVNVALALAYHTAKEKNYPSFVMKQSEIAKVTGLSPRAISASVQFLALNNVISVRTTMGMSNTYKWNESFLKGTAQGSVVPLNEVQSRDCKTFRPTTERGACIYIEFSLELFITSFKGFFDEKTEGYRPYSFYTPGKRKKKGDLNDAASRGTLTEVHREQAWRDAVSQVYDELQRRKFNDALVRIYLALRASNNIEDVKFPRSVLRFRCFDGESINEARSKSHIKEFLHTDDDFKDYIQNKLSKEKGTHGKECSGVH